MKKLLLILLSMQGIAYAGGMLDVMPPAPASHYGIYQSATPYIHDTIPLIKWTGQVRLLLNKLIKETQDTMDVIRDIEPIFVLYQDKATTTDQLQSAPESNLLKTIRQQQAELHQAMNIQEKEKEVLSSRLAEEIDRFIAQAQIFTVPSLTHALQISAKSFQKADYNTLKLLVKESFVLLSKQIQESIAELNDMRKKLYLMTGYKSIDRAEALVGIIIYRTGLEELDQEIRNLIQQLK